MKAIFILMCMFFLMFKLSAQEINLDEAQKKAQEFFFATDKSSQGLKSASVVKVDTFATYYTKIDNHLKSAGQKEESAFYIFNRTDKPGFVIVSADKRIKDIIAFSNNSVFSDPNPGLKVLLNQYVKEISYVKENNINSIILPNANNLASNGEWLLGNIEWHQVPDPYNSKCPPDVNSIAGNGIVPTGCVATAMAQIIYYYKYPRFGKGNHSYYSNYRLENAPFENTEYKYELMENKATYGTKNDDIATLLYHCGVSVDMEYGPNGSGAEPTTKIEDAFETYFNYKDCNVKEKTILSFSWGQSIKDEIENGRPVYYEVDPVNIGEADHAFIIDGYDFTFGEIFHINWGYGGVNNAWYSLSLLNTSYGNYSPIGQRMIIGIEPKDYIDLVPINQSLSSATVQAGDNITAFCAEENRGNTSSSSNDVTFWLSLDNILREQEDIKLDGQITFPSLAAKSSSPRLNGTVYIPSDIPSANYHLFFWADGNEEVTESDDNNNFVSVPLTVTAAPNPNTPIINTPSPSSLAFGDVTVNETSTKNFSISGSDLTGNVSVAVSGTGFTISKSETSGFSTSSLSYSLSGGTLSSQKVYVRFSPTSAGSKAGSISVTSSGANTKTVSLSGTGVSGGSAPLNDNLCSPQPLTIRTSCSYENFTTINATSPSPDIPFTGASLPYQPGRYDDDVWFSITPTFSAPITIKVVPTSNTNNFDVSVGLYQGNCSNPTQIQIGQGVAGGAGATETINFTSQANTTYFIRVFSYDIGSSYSGDFNICVTGSGGGSDDCNITFFDGDDPEDVIYSNTEHSESVTIEGDPNCSFTVSESCSWLAVTPTSGTIQSNGQSFLDFYFDKNTSTSQRQCTFYINGLPVTVTQDGEESDEDDFYIQNATVSTASIIAGSKVEVTCIQCYSGNKSDSEMNSCRVGYYLSANKLFNVADDVFLDDDLSTLGEDDPCNEEDADLTIPTSVSGGTYYLLFVADNDEEFSEINENNNVYYIQVNITGSALDDDFFVKNEYAINNITFPGGILAVSYDNCYSGSALKDNLGYSAVGFYLSNDQSYNASTDVYLGSSNSTIGSENPVNDEIRTLDIPSDISPGIYYIVLIADYKEKFHEIDETNNIKFAQFTVVLSPTGNDFYINNAMALPATIPVGDTLEISCNQCYLGTTLDANLASSYVGYYLSNDINFDTLTDIYSGRDASSLGQDYPFEKESFSFTIPTDISSGNYYILFVADYDYRFPNETNEDNNVAYQQITVIGMQTPTISVSETSLEFGSIIENTYSSPQSFTVSGNNLTADISLSTPAEFEISKSSGSGYGNSLSLTQSGSTVSSTTIYVRFSPTSEGEKSGNVSITSTGAETKNVAVSGTGTGVILPSITVSITSLPDFGNVELNNYSSPKSFNVSGTNLTSNVYLSAPVGFEISKTSGSGYGSSLSLTQFGGTVSSTTIYVRFSPTSEGAKSGNVSITSTDAEIKIVAVSGTGTTCTPPVSPNSATASNTTITLGQSTTLQVNGGALNSAPEWMWITRDSEIIYVGSGSTLVVSPSKTTTYYVQAAACTDSTILRSVTITVTGENTDTNDFYVQNADAKPTTVAAGGTVEVSCNQCYSGSITDANMGSSRVGYYLSANISFSSTADTELGTDGSSLGSDDLCNSESATLTIPTGTAAGTYYILFVADYNGQFSESDENNNVAYQQITVDNTTGIDDEQFWGQIKIYPNPTTGIITIEGLSENESTEITIYDVNRKLIKSLVSSSSSTKLDISDVVTGAYLIVINNQFEQSFKIIKE